MSDNEDEEHEIGPDDEDDLRGEEPKSEKLSEAEDAGRERGFRLPAGFVQSLLPNMDELVAKVVAPWQEQMRSVLPDYGALARETLASINERFQEQVALSVTSIPTFSASALDLPSLQGFGTQPRDPGNAQTDRRAAREDPA